MIQELFGGAANSPLIAAAAGGAEGNFINGGIILHGTPAATAGAASSPSPAASPSSSSTSSVAVTAATAETQQNLRCPRCDSSNTKFCYYNNYNLTQPRHFCKTCRRYWTKGGALRNVPIGGGCRKNKTSTHISSTVTKSTVAKFKAADMEIRAASHLIGGGGFDPHDLTSGPVPWAPPQSAQILALLRGNPINPNPNPNIKEEGNIFGTSHGIGNGLGLGLDPLIGHQLPNSMGLCGSFWRNNGNINQHQMAAAIQQNHGYHHHHQASELQNQSAMQALYQRIKLSTGESNNTADHNSTHQSCSNTIMASSSSIMEQPLMATTTSTSSADQMVYWQNNNAPAFCWSDLPTTTSNGAYP